MSEGPYTASSDRYCGYTISGPNFRAYVMGKVPVMKLTAELNRLHARAVAAERVVEAAREYREAPATSARYALDALFAALDAAEGGGA